MVRFLKPEHEARFRRLYELLNHLPMAEATRLVAEAGVVDDATGEPFKWEGFPMVLPVSDTLQNQVYGEDYETKVTDELERVDLSLAET
jgi:hypothetical protein